MAEKIFNHKDFDLLKLVDESGYSNVKKEQKI